MSPYRSSNHAFAEPRARSHPPRPYPPLLETLESRLLLSDQPAASLDAPVNPQRHTTVGEITVFLAGNLYQPREFWRTDGTPQGTVKLVDLIRYSTADAEWPPLWHIGNRLLFLNGTPASGEELWVTDGTVDGTRMLMDISPGSGSSDVSYLTTFGPYVYFTARDRVHGRELWRTDASPQGTRMVADINPGRASSSPSLLTTWGKFLILPANDGAHGIEPWYTNGTPKHTRLIKDINPGRASSDVRTLFSLGKLLIFAADDGIHGSEPWRSNGTPKGTFLLRDLVRGSLGSAFSRQTIVGNNLFFTISRGQYKDGDNIVWPLNTLFRTDGTQRGTVLLKRLGGVRSMFNLNGRLVLLEDDSSGLLYLWRSDGTPQGTVTYDHVAGPRRGTMIHANMDFSLSVQSSKAFFHMQDPEEPYYLYGSIEPDLYITDGTSVKELMCDQPPDPSDVMGEVDGPVTVNGSTYFIPTFGHDGNPTSSALWRFDDATNTLVSAGSLPFVYRNYMTFAGSQYIRDNSGRLWTTDGTAAGTVDSGFVFDAAYGHLATLGRYTVFVYRDSDHGRELWITDGTPPGTRMFTDINPGPAHGVSDHMPFFVLDNNLIFQATDGLHAYEWWVWHGDSLDPPLPLFTAPPSAPSSSAIMGIPFTPVATIPCVRDQG